MCITFAEHHTCTPAWLNIKGPTAVSTRRIGDKMSGHVINTELFTPRTSAKIIISPEVVETVSFHKQTLSITPASHIIIFTVYTRLHLGISMQLACTNFVTTPQNTHPSITTAPLHQHCTPPSPLHPSITTAPLHHHCTPPSTVPLHHHCTPPSTVPLHHHCTIATRRWIW